MTRGMRETTYRWVVLAAVGWALAPGGELAHAGKNPRNRKSKPTVSRQKSPPLMVLSPGSHPSSSQLEEYVGRMGLSLGKHLNPDGLAPPTWWMVRGDLQSSAREVASRALKHRDGYIWVSEPRTHKKLMIGELQTPMLELGAVREVIESNEAAIRAGREFRDITMAQVGRYHCAPSSYRAFHDQHQPRSKTPLPDVSEITPLVLDEQLAQDPRCKEKELRRLLTVDPEKKEGSSATRITASFAEMNVETGVEQTAVEGLREVATKGVVDGDSRVVDSLHLQLPSGGEICFTVDRPMVVSPFTFEPLIAIHSRDNPMALRQSKSIDELPSPENVARLLNLVQMADRGTLSLEQLRAVFE